MLFAGNAHAFSKIVAFGDSLSDNGNAFALSGGTTPPPPYFNGRFSNGPVWVETLAGNLGLSLEDHAIGGSTTADINLQIAAAGAADPNALYTVWGGANDFLALGPTDDPIAAIGTAVTNLLTGIGALMTGGAQHFLVMSLPDLGLTPRSLTSPEGGAGPTAISDIFNNSLLFNLGATFPGADISFMNTFDLLRDVVGNPALFGLTNVTDACLVGLTPCANPDEYAFWDDIHPTNALHNLLAGEAQLIVAPVPVPAAVWLFGSALGLLGWMRRKAA